MKVEVDIPIISFKTVEVGMPSSLLRRWRWVISFKKVEVGIPSSL